MSASLPTLPNMERYKEDFLTCPICSERYNCGDHQAKYLSCLHTYCRSCLEKDAGDGSKFTCLKCRTEFSFSDDAVENLPNNFVVENLIEYRDILNYEGACGICDDTENKSVSFCKECKSFLCQICFDQHKRMRPFQHHEIVILCELQNTKFNPITWKGYFCEDHPEQHLSLYCQKIGCQMPLCVSCGLSDHRGHDIMDLTAAFDNLVFDLHKSSTKVKERKLEMEEKRSEIENMQEKLTENFEKKAKFMKSKVQSMHDFVDSCHDAARKRLKQMYKEEMNKLTTKIESINSLTAQVDAACDFADQACDMSHPTQLLASQQQIVDKLDALVQAEVPGTASDKLDFAFTNGQNNSYGNFYFAVTSV